MQRLSQLRFLFGRLLSSSRRLGCFRREFTLKCQDGELGGNAEARTCLFVFFAF